MERLKELCMNNQYKYYAFISYSHKDSEWAKWLQHELEYYQLPSTLNGKPDLPTSFRPVFRDEDELSGGDLKPQITSALASSNYLIVICSPNSAKSKYVNDEIKEFIEIGKIKGVNNMLRIFPIIFEGYPNAENEEFECFPNAIKELSRAGIELIAGDVTKVGINHAFVKILAGTLQKWQIKFDDLWNRYEREKIEKEQREREEKERLQRIESLYLAELAEPISHKQGYITSLKLLLEAIPHDLNNPDRPFIVEAESRLFDIYRNFNYSKNFLIHTHIVQTYFDDSIIAFSPSGTEIAVVSQKHHIEFLDAQTFRATGKVDIDINIPISRIWGYSKNGKKLLVQLPYQLIIIDIKSSEYFSIQSVSTLVSANEDASIIIYVSTSGDISVFDHKNNNIREIYHISLYGSIPVTITDDFENIVILDNSGNLYTYNILANSFSIKKLKHCKIDDECRYHVRIIDERLFVIGEGDIIIGVYNIINSRKVDKFLTNKKFIDSYKTTFVTISNNITEIWSCSNVVTQISQLNKKIISNNIQYGYFITSELDNELYFHQIINGQVFTYESPITLKLLDYEYPVNNRGIPIKISPCGDFIALVRDSIIEFIKIKNLRNHTHCIVNDNIQSISISPDGSSLAYGLWDGTIHFRSINHKFDDIQVLCGHNRFITSISFSLDNTLLLSGSADNTLRVWDTATYKQIGDSIKQDAMIVCAQFTSDAKRITSISRDNTLRIWDLPTRNEIIRYELKRFDLSAFSSDGRYVIIARSDYCICLIDINIGKVIGEINNIDIYQCKEIQFTGNNQLFYVRLLEDDFALYDVSTCKQVFRSHIHGFNFSIRYDGMEVACSSGNEIYLQDIKTGKYIIKAMPHTHTWIRSISYSPDGKKLIIGEANGRVTQWDINSWQQVGKPLIDPDQNARDIIHFSAVESIDFNNEANKMLITLEKNIKIIDYIAPQDLIIESNKIIANTKMTSKEKELLGIKYSL